MTFVGAEYTSMLSFYLRLRTRQFDSAEAQEKGSFSSIQAVIIIAMITSRFIICGNTLDFACLGIDLALTPCGIYI